MIAVSERSLLVGCNTPYPGWSAFKSAILMIVSIVDEINIIQTIQRYSMKYIDLIPSANPREQVSLIHASVMIGGHTLEKESFSLKIEIAENGIKHIVNIVSSAVAKLRDGSRKEGL